MLLVTTNILKAQSIPWVFPGNTPTSADFVGTTNGVPLQLMTTNTTTPVSIDFWTTNTWYMSLTTNGDLNMIDAAKGYQIDGNYVLWHKGDVSCILGGVGAGLNNTGPDNTFYGHNSGFTTTNSVRCTFLGSQAGYYNTGNWNTFTGYKCGYANTSGNANSFYGKHCAFNNLSGSYNSIFGTYCAATNTTGDSNCYMGVNCALWSNGHGNVGLGFNAGYNNAGWGDCYMGTFASYYGSGDLNTYIGYATQYTGLTGSTSFTNTTALGANAVVANDNQAIIGDNQVNVGLGLSNDNIYFGPRDRLEINLGLYNLINPADYGFDEPPALDANFYSGLQFRDLTSWNTPTDNRTCNPDSGTGICAVLSVDPHGRVILVKENIGAAIGYCSTVGPTSLTDNAALNLNEWNYNYMVPTVPTTQNNSVGIGYDICNPTLLARLDVRNETSTTVNYPYTDQYAGKFYQTGSYTGTVDMVGVYGESNVTGDKHNNIGGDFYANKSININIGARGTGEFSDGINYGIYGSAINSNILNTGVYGEANSGTAPINYGGYFRAQDATQSNIGVNSEVINPDNMNVGLQINSANASSSNYGSIIKVGPPSAGGGTVNMGEDITATSAMMNYGIHGRIFEGSYSSGPTYNIGCSMSTIASTTFNPNSQYIGGEFYARGDFSDPTAKVYGVRGIANGFFCPPNPGCVIGVYGQAPGPCVPGGPMNSWAGYFTGQIFAGGWISPSDSTLKQDIDTIPNALNLIKALKPHIYRFNTTQFPYMSLPGNLRYGLISQEVEQVLPDLVVNTNHPAQYDSANNQISPSKPFLGLEYTELIPILIQGMKTQQNMIDTLTAQNIFMHRNIDSLWNALNNCCSKNNPAQQNIAPPQNNDNGNGGSGNEKKLENGNIHAIELSNAAGSPIIYQNVPNPFSNGGTKIRYFVPDNTNNPQIVFFDEFGGKLSTYAILETGMGELDVTASNLSSGVYSYSLIINGKAIDTKKMIFQK